MRLNGLILLVFLACAGFVGAQSPWLPRAEHEHIWKLWPDGVPYADGLGFYSLPRASQRLAKTNEQPSRGFHSGSGINLEFPYIGSGGMDWAENGTWRNVTGLAIPKGQKIAVTVQSKPVLNEYGYFQTEQAMFWAFPAGTQAYDVLLRRHRDGTEHIFNVRVRTKIDAERWDDGASYFPEIATEKTVTYTTIGNARTRDVLGLQRLAYRVAEIAPLPIRRYRFREATIAYNDGGNFFPPGFKGTGATCSKCHVTGMAGESAPYAGPELRGRDTVFSWYPVRVESIDNGAEFYTPSLDYRWPIK